MRPPRSKCNSLAHFFKFIPPGFKYQLEIPSSFRKYIKNKNHNKTAILRRGCQEWRVKTNGWAFGEGWEIFVRENGVQDYDFVIFKHEGNMVFDTMVFDPSCCEREYPTNQGKTLQAETPCLEAKGIGKLEMDIDASKKISKRKHAYIKKSTKSLLKSSDHDHRPCFNGTLTPSCKYRLYLPTNFTRSNGLLSTGKLILKYGQTQKLWTADLNICTTNSYCIGRGWHDFYIENGLKDQDPFKLEIVQTGNKPIVNFHRLSEETPKQKAATVTLETEDSSSHPCFDATLRQYSISSKTLYVPKNFGVANRLRDGEIILRNEENEGSWIAKITNRSGKYFIIQNGLYEFCVANRLNTGNNLRFKLIQNEEKPVATISRVLNETPKVKAVENPSFKSTVTAYGIKRSLVNIPIGFARSNRLVNMNRNIDVMDEKQRVWPTNLYCRHNRIRLKQLREIWVANGLKEGDEFVLELVHIGKKKTIMKFHSMKTACSSRESNQYTAV